MKRKPDYVFNVWGDGVVLVDPPPGFVVSAKDLRLTNKACRSKYRITHRIKVYLKEQK